MQQYVTMTGHWTCPPQEGQGRHFSQALALGRAVLLLNTLFAIYFTETMNHFNDHFLFALATRKLRAKSATTSSH